MNVLQEINGWTYHVGPGKHYEILTIDDTICIGGKLSVSIERFARTCKESNENKHFVKFFSLYYPEYMV